MDYCEYPFVITSEIKEMATNRMNCIVYQIEVMNPHSGKVEKKVVKEVQEDSYMLDNYLGPTLEEKAGQMKKVYTVIREHLGEYVEPTEILIGKGVDGKSHILLLQNLVLGVGLHELPKNHPARKKFYEEIAPMLQNKLNIALMQLREQGIPENAISWIKNDAIAAPKNVMWVTSEEISSGEKNQTYRLIDVL